MSQLAIEIKKALGDLSGAFGEFKDANNKRVGACEQTVTSMERAMKESVLPFVQRVSEFIDATEEEQARGGRNPARQGSAKSLGAEIAKHERLQEVIQGKSGQVSFTVAGRSLLREYKADLYGSPAGSPGSSIPLQAIRLPGVANDPRRRITLLDALPHQTVKDGNSFEYLRLSDAYAPNAALQSTEGASKAEAAIPCDLATGSIFTVANWIPISTQLLSDAPTISRWVDGLLTYACMLQLEEQIIVGNSSLVTGLLEVATTAMTNAKTSKADKLGEAAAVLATLGWNPNIVLIHPLDEFDIESEKATGGNEQYVSAPSGGKFWKLAPVATPKVPQGTALVLDSSQATIMDREEVNVTIGTINDQFVRNMRTLLVEGRFGFTFAAASAIKRVTF